MALSGKKEATCGYNNHYHMFISIVVNKQNLETGKSNVTVTFTCKSDSNTYEYAGNSAVKLTVDGSQKVNETKSVNFSSMRTVTLASWTGDIEHDANGDKKISVSASWTATSNWVSGGNISFELSLDNIPRATKPTLSVTTIELGKVLTIGIAPAVAGWKHKLYYYFGSGTWADFQSGATGNYNWTVPLAIASKLPDVTSGTMTIALKTYSDAGMTKQVGSTQTINVKVTIPATVKPTISSVAVSEAGDGIDGAFTQGKTKLKLKTAADGIYGSTIKSIKHKIAGTDYTADDDWTSGIIYASGTVAITTTVTDSRGRSASKNTNVTVYAYAPPLITRFECQRCNENGEINRNGSRIKITSAFAVSPVNNKNGNTYQIEYKKSSDNDWTSLITGNIYDYDQDYISEAVFSTSDTYDVRLTVTDSFNASEAAEIVTSAFRLWSYIIKKSAWAFGKIAELANTLDVALVTIFRENVTLYADLLDANGRKYILKAYPVGSIYMSVNNTNPGTLFGGTWSAWGTGRVPVGVNGGDSDFNTPEKTGGEKTHKLTTNEIPKHNHTPRLYHNQNYNNRKLPAAVVYSLWSTAMKYADTEINGNWGIGGFTDDVGNDVPHNNLQPYITCYMWKRIA